MRKRRMPFPLGYLYVVAAAVLWGIIGLFITQLYAIGFTPVQVVAVRALFAVVLLALYALVKNGFLPRIHWTDSRYFLGTGIFSVALFSWCLFKAIEQTSIAIATILLYTAPAFVTVLSRILFKEVLTTKKIVALSVTFVGCSLVAGILPQAQIRVSPFGLLLGLGAGFFYALYSIFGKMALRRYPPLTVTIYTFLFTAIAVTPISQPRQWLPFFQAQAVWFPVLGLAFLSTVLAFLLYTQGLNRIEASRAAIIATIEPVVAALVSWTVFGEQLTQWQYAGMGLVLVAVILVEAPSTQPARSTPS